MAGQRKTRKVTREETVEMWDSGYLVEAYYIGVVEGYDYALAIKGGLPVCFRKSPRACYNYFLKIKAGKVKPEQLKNVARHGL